MLASTGVAGNPVEHFNLPAEKWPRFQEHYDAISQLNPLGIKTSFGGLVRAAEIVGEAEFRETPCIHLKRRDTLGQAISNYRAMMTGQWYRPQGEPIISPECLPDREAIFQLKRQYENTNDQLWPDWFRQMQIEPFEVWYEEMHAAPIETVKSVCSYLGFAEPSHIDTNSLELQRDEITQEWKELLLGQGRE
jgi:LPS sulfotransferase NodH